jgi:hypothetical protein
MHPRIDYSASAPPLSREREEMTKKTDALKTALTLIIVLGILSTLHSVSTIYLGSDDCQPALLYHDLIETHNIFFRNWHLVTDSFLLTDLPVYAFVGKFIGMNFLTIRAGAWCIFAASVLLASIISYHAFERRAVLLTAAMLLSIPVFARNLVLKPFIHMGTTCFALLAVLVMLLVMKRRREDRGTGIHLVALFLFSTAAAFSDPYFIFLFTVPAAFSYAIITVKAGGNVKREAIMLPVLLVSAAAGVMLQRGVEIFGLHIYSMCQSLPAYPTEPDTLYLHFLYWIASVLNLFGANFVTEKLPLSWTAERFLAFLLFFMVALLTTKRLKRKDWDVGAFPLLWASAFTVILSAAFIFMAAPGERYLMPLLYGAALSFGGILTSPGNESEKRIFGTLIGIFLVIAAFNTWAGFRGAPSETPYGNIVQVLEEKGLNYGYASFRYAPATTVFADWRVKVRQVHFIRKAIQPFYWCAKEDWYRAKAYEGRTFLILGKHEDQTFNRVTPDLILKEFGKPIEVFPVEGAVIYVWPYNIARMMPAVL